MATKGSIEMNRLILVACLNIGGFSDAVFNVVASYLGDDAARFVAKVESVEL